MCVGSRNELSKRPKLATSQRFFYGTTIISLTYTELSVPVYYSITAFVSIQFNEHKVNLVRKAKIDEHFFMTYKQVSTDALEGADLINIQGFLIGY